MPDGFNALKKRILEEYEQAYKEISAKAQDFADKSKVRELEMRAKLKDGKITQAQFDSWMKGQVFQGAQWEDRKKQMAATLRHADEVAAQMANGERFRQFAYGHNRIAYEITKDAGVMINFTQYDADTVRRLIKDRPDLLPPRKLAGKDKAYSYYNRMMDRIATQGILQGESVQKIAQRIAKQTGESAAGAALRNARTMQTGAQNAGRLEGMHRAQDMGIKLKKMWIATLDGRTRDSHRDLDGQTQDIDKPFDSPLGDIMFPGDPDAKPGNVWNCRCTLGNSYPEYPYSILKRRDNETKQIVENMTYRDWEKATGRATEQPSTKAKRRAIITADNAAEYARKALSDAYEYHRIAHNLNIVPRDDVDPTKVNYGSLDEKVKIEFSEELSELCAEYDTTLQNIRPMTQEERMYLGNNFACVGHHYSMDSSEMLLNTGKLRDSEKLVNRVRELSENGYIIPVKAGKEIRYIIDHEFAHSLFDMESKLKEKYNHVKADYGAIKGLRKEAQTLYDKYIDEVGRCQKAKDREFDKYIDALMNNANESELRRLEKIANAAEDALNAVKISDYSMENADEFFAEAFACERMGVHKSYSTAAFNILKRQFGR